MLNERPLFNTEGDDSPSNQSLIHSNPTGILNLDECKYKWVNPLYRQMTGNFWIPERVDMSSDIVSKDHLTEDEDFAVQATLSFLIYLDSIQVANLDNIAEYITNSGVSNLLKIHTFQEVIHSQSYQYILQNLYPSSKRQEIYNMWRNNPILMERNKYIASIYQKFLDNKTEENFKRVIVANFLLEGIYFYQGFNFFEQLASRNKLTQTNDVIQYIKVDEGSHLAIFTNIIREGEIVDVTKDADWIQEMMSDAVSQDIEWAKYIYGNKIMGITEQSAEQYLKWLGNNRLNAIGVAPIYENTVNPYKHLEGGKEGNFFEATITSYSRSESIEGWEDF